MKKTVVIILFVLIAASDTIAQCAMCRATLENNLSNGNIGIAAGINFGIMYLFMAPYTAIALVAYFWYRTSRKNAKNLNQGSTSM